VKWLGPLFLVVILPSLLSEFTDWCPTLAEHLVRRAVRRLPEGSRARWEEEWLGDLAAFKGRRLSILVRGLWIYIRAPSWGRTLRGLPPISHVLVGRIKHIVSHRRRRPKPVARIYIENASAESMKGATVDMDRIKAFLQGTKATSVKVRVVPRNYDGLSVGTDIEGTPLVITSWESRRRFRRTWTWRAPSQRRSGGMRPLQNGASAEGGTDGPRGAAAGQGGTRAEPPVAGGV
jgi:hypothetical protein